MKNIGDLGRAMVENPHGNSQNGWQESLRANRDRARIARVFAYFRAWFPHFQADDLMLEAWAQDTGYLSDSEFKTGLERTKQAGLQHAPSLPKWLELCKPETGSPRYLGANPINMTELRIAGLLPQGEKKVHDATQMRAALRSAQPSE